MKTTMLTLAIALALGALAGCDRTPDERAGAGASSNTPSTPANVGAPSAAEKKDGANPVQGQVDPKEGAQQKDFKQGGDSAGPKPGG